MLDTIDLLFCSNPLGLFDTSHTKVVLLLIVQEKNEGKNIKEDRGDKRGSWRHRNGCMS
jgi:hypothetical protein